jgi:predicted nucleotidyltransferase
MLTSSKILDTLRIHKPYFQKELGVIRIGLFGSYAKNNPGTDSDIDIFVELKSPNYNSMVEILATLEKDLDKKVDLTRKGPHLRRQFLQSIEKDLLYA